MEVLGHHLIIENQIKMIENLGLLGHHVIGIKTMTLEDQIRLEILKEIR